MESGCQPESISQWFEWATRLEQNIQESRREEEEEKRKIRMKEE